MTTIAFIGLGIMGAPMAAHLQRAGFSVVGFNRSPGKSASLEAAGGRAAESIAQAVADARIIAVMVPDTTDVVEVLTSPGGVFDSALPGALIIDFSSIRPDVTVQIAQRARSLGFGYLDAPVSGGQVGAERGALSIMVGGTVKDFNIAAAVFAPLGQTVVHVGPSGAGQTVKAANQMIVATHLQALAEALTFLRASGVDLQAALTVLAGGLATSKVLQAKSSNMIGGSFAPGFRIELHHKDLGIATAAAREVGVFTPVAALVAELMGAAVSSGDGALDHSALIRVVERLSCCADESSPTSGHASPI